MNDKKLEDYRKESGYYVQDNGRPLCPGVVCRCHELNFCPLHGEKKGQRPTSSPPQHKKDSE